MFASLHACRLANGERSAKIMAAHNLTFNCRSSLPKMQSMVDTLGGSIVLGNGPVCEIWTQLADGGEIGGREDDIYFVSSRGIVVVLWESLNLNVDINLFY